MRGPAQEKTAAVRRVVQAVLQRPAALPLPSAGANLRRVRPVTAGLSGAFLLLKQGAIWVEPWSFFRFTPGLFTGVGRFLSLPHSSDRPGPRPIQGGGQYVPRDEKRL